MRLLLPFHDRSQVDILIIRGQPSYYAYMHSLKIRDVWGSVLWMYVGYVLACSLNALITMMNIFLIDYLYKKKMIQK